jgi:hypothetical protein
MAGSASALSAGRRSSRARRRRSASSAITDANVARRHELEACTAPPYVLHPNHKMLHCEPASPITIEGVVLRTVFPGSNRSFPQLNFGRVCSYIGGFRRFSTTLIARAQLPMERHTFTIHYYRALSVSKYRVRGHCVAHVRAYSRLSIAADRDARLPIACAPHFLYLFQSIPSDVLP